MFVFYQVTTDPTSCGGRPVEARAQRQCEDCELPEHAVGYRLRHNGPFVPASGCEALAHAGLGYDAPGRVLGRAEAQGIADVLNGHSEGEDRRTAHDAEGRHWFVIRLQSSLPGRRSAAAEHVPVRCQTCHRAHLQSR